ncbi:MULTISPECIES: RlmE family RNA methyltransferase [unclassified Rhizobium]|jgi:23S rRNA (uridine2552-2'-O)-methyltransferase|uniref:RlmE family RNA methyltransferase n=1 Tax=Rhizobium/Agrobacterium group TaxID=227290 RepID=UPI000715A284|nr:MULTISPECIES: RlmE family RNA methyltransferase [unclassified Rhizobium]KQQ73805.1 23S rRNA methyltransferase [Rhizobium sp. Leaf321]MBD8649484.1 RlmE family RNA methyltransferase [Rhizobium sp. CFBP 13726]MBD8664100.1 RlmE family RNA methyltransferase [Rhizobium sp. CFBP 8752]MBP2463531.1 23S rRNA (uridine2552-2'-O)-methyltransferase [Rhizobium sp. PvP014]MBP2530926.1 23S rRNA (uridine2552-2'-O)-methyltransferase [Rhizobium sp. PvP099]
MTKPSVGGNRTGRKLGQKVKKGKLKASSRRWLERHINDPYVQRAKLEGYRARAAFKLLEIDEKHQLLKGARRIIDLGAAPGSWSQIAAKVTESSDDDMRVAAIDFLEMAPLAGVKILQLDFLDDDAPRQLMEAIGGTPDVVLSDMAAPTTGHHRTDHLRTMHLCEVAAHFAVSVLGEGGHFLAKTFQGGTEKDLLDMLKKNFKQVIHIKPGSSRQESVEMFLLAKHFKGQAHRLANEAAGDHPGDDAADEAQDDPREQAGDEGFGRD